MIKQVLFNPFRKIAGFKALILGIAIMTLSAVIAYFSHCHFDGIIDVHIWVEKSIALYFIEFLIDWGAVVILFYLAGKMLSHAHFRFLDIAGTAALARFPCFFVALIAFGIPEMKPADFQNLQTVPLKKLIELIAAGLLTVVFIIWVIALLYQAFKISCNLKGRRAVWGFIVALLIAEILSEIIFHYLYRYY